VQSRSRQIWISVTALVPFQRRTGRADVTVDPDTGATRRQLGDDGGTQTPVLPASDDASGVAVVDASGDGAGPTVVLTAAASPTATVPGPASNGSASRLCRAQPAATKAAQNPKHSH
jgi:hypothetical protein